MLKPWTMSFEVDGTWYDLHMDLAYKAERAIGKEWTNKKIVEYLRDRGYKFTTDPTNGFVTIS